MFCNKKTIFAHQDYYQQPTVQKRFFPQGEVKFFLKFSNSNLLLWIPVQNSNFKVFLWKDFWGKVFLFFLFLSVDNFAPLGGSWFQRVAMTFDYPILYALSRIEEMQRWSIPRYSGASSHHFYPHWRRQFAFVSFNSWIFSFTARGSVPTHRCTFAQFSQRWTKSFILWSHE